MSVGPRPAVPSLALERGNHDDRIIALDPAAGVLGEREAGMEIDPAFAGTPRRAHALVSPGPVGHLVATAMRDDGGIAFEFQPSRSDRSPGRELLTELIGCFNEIYPGRAARPGSVTTPDEMVPPHGVFLVGYENGEAIAIGGLRPLEENGLCEIKRMYVVPTARSRGAGRALLTALEDAARALGYQRIRLDAGPEQRHSRALFANAGYVEIARYNENHIADYFAEKRL